MYGQITCLVLGLLSTSLCAATTFWSNWAISSPESASVMGPIKAWKGIWSDCMQLERGQFYCKEQRSMLLADGEVCNSSLLLMLRLIAILVGELWEEKKIITLFILAC